MTTLIGRPPIPGFPITLRLTDAALDMMDKGAQLQATINKKAPSRAAWFRELLDFTFSGTSLENTMSADMLATLWPPAWFEQPTPHKVTMKIEERHRILLRQFECYVQSLDWIRDMQRNEAALLLMAAHGPVFNRSLEVRALRAGREEPDKN